MRRHLIVAAGIAVLAFFASAQNKPDRSLKTTLSYTGSGKVDAKHKIFVFLFDSPDFTQGGVMPLASQSATDKNQTVTFSGISVPTVYVAAAFDPTGSYDGMSGPPPSGSSLGMYFKEGGRPAPVSLEAGKTVQIELAFDDSARMP